jgi:hypothetical protein
MWTLRGSDAKSGSIETRLRQASTGRHCRVSLIGEDSEMTAWLKN